MAPIADVCAKLAKFDHVKRKAAIDKILAGSDRTRLGYNAHLMSALREHHLWPPTGRKRFYILRCRVPECMFRQLRG